MALNRPPTPTADLLADAGRALYGEAEWKAPLSRELGVNMRTIQAWLSGKTQLAPDHSVMRDTLGLLNALKKAIETVLPVMDEKPEIMRRMHENLITHLKEINRVVPLIAAGLAASNTIVVRQQSNTAEQERQATMPMAASASGARRHK